jgi:uncharacterized heparinase superfamily protein
MVRPGKEEPGIGPTAYRTRRGDRQRQARRADQGDAPCYKRGFHACAPGNRLRQPARTALAWQPSPEASQIAAGNFLFAGFLIEAPGKSIWDIAVPDYRFEESLHGFSWLDDLAAVDDAPARTRAQDWTFDWIARFGRGAGPGWTPDLTGRRLIRWINHAILLLNGRDRTQARAYFRSLGQQTIFLSRSWKSATPGLPRFEALTGLIYAGLALTGMERHVAAASGALARECAREIDSDGGIPTRNPEELLKSSRF